METFDDLAIARAEHALRGGWLLDLGGGVYTVTDDPAIYGRNATEMESEYRLWIRETQAAGYDETMRGQTGQAITVTIRECGESPRAWISTHRTADPHEAESLAICRTWGKRARLHVDHGSTTDETRYGQIVEPSRHGGLDCLTGRVSVRTETVDRGRYTAGEDVLAMTRELRPWRDWQ